MNPLYQVKHQAKQIRWRARRAQASLHWGAEKLSASPIVFGTAIPKAGSHLLSQILHTLPRVGAFINTGFPPVNRDEENQKLSQEKTLANLKALRSGDTAYGYLSSKQPFLDIITAKNWATIFIYRDPRDVITSSVFYISKLNPKHALHKYYTERLQSVEKCIEAEIHGITEPGFEYTGVRKKFESYLGWFSQSDVHTVSFEDMILNQESALEKLLAYLESRGAEFSMSRAQAVSEIREGIQPSKSGTFRKGQTGGWKEHFTEKNKESFKQAAGNILIQYGYEKDNNW